MRTFELEKPKLVGVTGTRWLFAETADIESGERNGPSQVVIIGYTEPSPVKPLQVWFKFAQWNEPDADDERRAADMVEKAAIEGGSGGSRRDT